METPGASYQDASFAFKTAACANRLSLTSRAYIHYCIDNENSSVKAKDKVFAVCTEYDEIERFLKDKNINNQNILDFKFIAQGYAYLWNLDRIAHEFKAEFIEKFVDEFYNYYINNKLTLKFMKKINIEDRNIFKSKEKLKNHLTQRVKERETLISVIVPIYNVEKYLNQAIDSILAQTHRNLEVILVDDGSKDNCGQICDDYAAQDNRIKVIHKENGGLGAAYNTGIEIATGDYIAFVEPDDYIDANMYEVMLENAIKYNTDATKCGFYYYNSTKKIQNCLYCITNLLGVTEPNNSFTIDDYPYLCAYHSSIWSYLYRADFVKQIKFTEIKGGAAYVDAPFGFEMLCRAKSLSIVPYAFYHWRFEYHGNSTSFTDRRAIQMAYRFCEAKNIIKKYGKYNLLKELFYLHAAIANIEFFLNTEGKYKREYFNQLRELFIDIEHDKDFKWTYTEYYKNVILAINSNNYRKTIKLASEIIYNNISHTNDFYTNVFQRLFSVKNFKMNERKYKIITILGIKIKAKIKGL